MHAKSWQQLADEAVAEMNKQNYERAIELFNSALEVNPNQITDQ